jgi:hypothetical protein
MNKKTATSREKKDKLGRGRNISRLTPSNLKNRMAPPCIVFASILRLEMQSVPSRIRDGVDARKHSCCDTKNWLGHVKCQGCGEGHKRQCHQQYRRPRLGADKLLNLLGKVIRPLEIDMPIADLIVD